MMVMMIMVRRAEAGGSRPRLAEFNATTTTMLILLSESPAGRLAQTFGVAGREAGANLWSRRPGSRPRPAEFNFTTTTILISYILLYFNFTF